MPPTAAAGLSEWDTLSRPEERRVTTVHALGNTLVAVLFLKSWLDRGRGRQAAGVGWGLLGGALAMVTGYLGGHLSFARLVGTGHRSRPSQRPPAGARGLRREAPVFSAADPATRTHEEGPAAGASCRLSGVISWARRGRLRPATPRSRSLGSR